MKSAEVSKHIKNQLKQKLLNYGNLKVKGNRIVLTEELFRLDVSWSFLQSGTGGPRIFSFCWQISSKEIAKHFENVIKDSQLSDQEYFLLISQAQEYDKRRMIPKYFEASNEDEINRAINIYLNHLESEILQQLKINLNLQSILSLMIQRKEYFENSIPEKYRRVILMDYLNDKNSERELNSIDITTINYKRENAIIKFITNNRIKASS